MRRYGAAVALALLMALTGCASDAPDAPRTPAAGPAEVGTRSDPGTTDDGATLEEMCEAYHEVEEVHVEATADGVLVTWQSWGHSLSPRDYVVYRRPAGSAEWDRLERITRDEADLAYLDTRPADEPSIPHEYWVTRVEPDCGGESELCPDRLCDSPPSAVPRAD